MTNKITKIKNTSTASMSYREYRKTSAYKKEAKARAQELQKMFQPQVEFVADIARAAVKQAASVVEELKHHSTTEFMVPMHQNQSSIDAAHLNKIAQDAADRIVTKAGFGLQRKSEIVLFLTKDGDLFKEPKKEYHYSMQKSKLRLKILQLLTHEYMETEDISDKTESLSTASIRKAIHEINEKAEALLKLEEDLIENKPYSGYRINPIYRIENLEYE